MQILLKIIGIGDEDMTALAIGFLPMLIKSLVVLIVIKFTYSKLTSIFIIGELFKFLFGWLMKGLVEKIIVVNGVLIALCVFLLIFDKFMKGRRRNHAVKEDTGVTQEVSKSAQRNTSGKATSVGSVMRFYDED